MTTIKKIAFSSIALSAIWLSGCRRDVDAGILNSGNFTILRVP
jgi:hypothetical protein